jgi:hypothetical protein
MRAWQRALVTAENALPRSWARNMVRSWARNMAASSPSTYDKRLCAAATINKKQFAQVGRLLRSLLDGRANHHPKSIGRNDDLPARGIPFAVGNWPRTHQRSSVGLFSYGIPPLVVTRQRTTTHLSGGIDAAPRLQRMRCIWRRGCARPPSHPRR